MSWPLVQNMAILTKKEKKSLSLLMMQPHSNSIFALMGKRCRWHFILSDLGYIVGIGPCKHIRPNLSRWQKRCF